MDENTTSSDTSAQTSTPDVPPQNPEQHNTGMAVVAYILFFVPLLTDAKDDPFVKFHVKQGFVLFLAGVLVTVLSVVPPIMLIGWLLHLAVIALAIVGIVNAAGHKQEPLPFIGHFADRFHF